METIYYFKPIICLLDDYLLFKLLFKTDKKQLYFPKYPIEKEIKSHKQIQEQVHKLEKLFIDLNIKIANVNIIESFCLKQITKNKSELIQVYYLFVNQLDPMKIIKKLKWLDLDTVLISKNIVWEDQQEIRNHLRDFNLISIENDKEAD